MGGPKKPMRIGKVRTGIDGPAEGSDCVGIAHIGHGNEALRKMTPGLLGIARDRAIGPFSDLRKGGISILPTLKRAPCKTDRAQAKGLRVVVVQLDGAGEHVKGFLGAFVRMLTVEEHAAGETLPGIRVLGSLPFYATMLCSVEFGLNAPDHAFRYFILYGEDVVRCPIVTLRPKVIAGLCLNKLPGNSNSVAALAHAALEDIANP